MGVGSLSFLQGIFPTQGSNPGLTHCRWIFYQPSVQFSHSFISNSLQPHELQHARPPCPSPTPGVHSDSCPLSQWCHPAISSSVAPFSSCPQSLPASESFPMSQLFAWGGQSTGVSALVSFLPKNTQGITSHGEAQKYWSGQPIPSPVYLPDPGIEPGLLNCRRILYQLSYQGSPYMYMYIYICVCVCVCVCTHIYSNYEN